MAEEPTAGRRIPWFWWLLTALLGAALVIDVIDGAPLKLATSVLLFAACLLSALAPTPRPAWMGGAIVGCFGIAALLMVFRAFGPGL